MVENLPVPFNRRVWLEATTLTRHGYEVSVICPRSANAAKAFEVLEDVHIYRYGMPLEAGSGALGYFIEFSWCFMATAWLSLRVAVFGRGFDVLHACNPPDTFWLLGRFWSVFGVRYIFNHHDLAPEMFVAKFGRRNGFFYRALLWLERQSMAASHAVITTNESYKRIAMERDGKKAEDLFIVRSGPALDELPVYPRDRRYFGGKEHLLVYLGEICKQDGVEYLVRAARLLKEEFGRNDVRCLFVGGGPHQPAVKAYAEAAGIADFSEFTGRVGDDDLCRILSSATLGIDPDPKNEWSDRSTMNKVIEYMYFGLPVVAFDLHETRVSAGAAGAYAEANSERDMARVIAELLDDPERRARMGEAGRQRVREALAWDYSVAPLLAAYDRALGK